MDSSRKWASRYHFNVTRRSVSTSRAATSVTRCTILRRPFKLFTYSDPKFECAFLLLRTHLPFKLFTFYFSRSPRTFYSAIRILLSNGRSLHLNFFTSTVVNICLFCAEPNRGLFNLIQPTGPDPHILPPASKIECATTHCFTIFAVPFAIFSTVVATFPKFTQLL